MQSIRQRNRRLLAALSGIASTFVASLALASGGSWLATSATSAPQGRYAHSAIWTDSKMIVWGGGSGEVAGVCGILNSGGIFDPAVNTWNATSRSGAPSAREFHSAVWTGSRMIVWGGFFWNCQGLAFNVFNDGAIYDPQTDTWTPVSQNGAPAARGNHTAIWTGSKMIVWGGDLKPVSQTPVNFHATNTGAIYDPVSNSWTPMSTVNAPTPRSVHTAVWTGSRMIVWGGDDGTSNAIDLNTGGIFDPETNSWIPTSTAGAPSGRAGHSAVWTGSRMIVWGGEGNNNKFENTGGIYDPESDTWAPTATAGAPSARVVHVAVWTGSQMIVWSGWDGTRDVNTGAIYDPVADTWTPTSTAAAPTGRESATSVWTGSGMIAWGGFDTTAKDVNSGGIFTPSASPCPSGGGRQCVSPVGGGSEAHSAGRTNQK